MKRLTAILIATTIFASVYGGAFANEHRPEQARPIRIEYFPVQPTKASAKARPAPKPERAYTVSDLSPEQRKLYYALLSS